MNTTSLWQGITEETVNYPVLDHDIETKVDVVIIGAGITGITTALLLTEAGLRVVVLEAHTVGSGTTGHSTGNLYVPVQPYYQTIVSHFSQEVAASVAHARREAIDFVEQTVQNKIILCHFERRPYFYYASQEEKIDKLQKELSILQQAGINVHETYDMPLPIPHRYAIRFDNQARFNPLKYVQGLAKYITEKGCQVYEHTQVLDFEEKADHVAIETFRGKLKASWVVEATHIPKGFNMVQTMTPASRSYVTAVYLKDGMYPDGEYADMCIPGHYISTHGVNQNAPEILCLAGNHHRTGALNEVNQYASQLEYLNQHFKVKEVAYRWSAQHYHSGDGLPYIGYSRRNSKRTLMATGFYADGLTYGTVSARILADMILEKQNPYRKIFDSTRFKPLASATTFIEANANVAKRFFQEPPISLKEENLTDVQNDEAKVVDHSGTRWAVYRDEAGLLHVVSAICTHLGCVVNWNKAEKTWDCPCHGSRFDIDGKVLEGPALSDLHWVHCGLTKEDEAKKEEGLKE